MPVRSSNSPVLKWPGKTEVLGSLWDWLQAQQSRHPELVRLGYAGSYARGDWGVGSDLDLIAIVTGTTEPFHRRGLSWDVNALPVPVDLLIYTVSEWEAIIAEQSRFARTIQREAVWIFP